MQLYVSLHIQLIDEVMQKIGHFGDVLPR